MNYTSDETNSLFGFTYRKDNPDTTFFLDKVNNQLSSIKKWEKNLLEAKAELEAEQLIADQQNLIKLFSTLPEETRQMLLAQQQKEGGNV